MFSRYMRHVGTFEHLERLFVWRLKLDDLDVVVLGLDTMVMDNDEAERREGCQAPTYRKV